MDAVIQKVLAGVKLGEGSALGPLTVLPLQGDLPLGPDYITLAEALVAGVLEVTEVGEAGSVPTLRAYVKGERSVLILDGEELLGAKQNRVLNTTVLLAAGEFFDLPVSCTERGRWSYTSRAFRDSGNVAAHAVRREAHRSVTANVRASQSYLSDQGRVWAEVDELAARHGVNSPTSAMRDVYEKRELEMKEFTETASVQEGQVGLMAVLDGEVVGFDLVSRPDAYAHLHGRLVQSYAFDAAGVEGSADAASDLRTAKDWLVALADLSGTEHDSPGMGVAHRFTGGGAIGAALVCDDAIVHASFFAAGPEDGGSGPRMSRVSRRRSWLSE